MMEIEEIVDRASLEKWFADKPYDWAPGLTFRAALRALPAINSTETEIWLGLETIRILRALTIVYVVNEKIAPINADAAVDFARVRFSDFLPGLFEGPARVATEGAIHGRLRSSSMSVSAVGRACSSFPYDWRNFSWEQIRLDCQLVQVGYPYDSASRLTKVPLWTNGIPVDWSSTWESMSGRLRAMDSNFQTLIEWFENRLAGKPFAFEIPGDIARSHEKMIFFRLIDADHLNFWGKGHEYVNAELTRWLEEARARAALPTISAEAHGTLELTGSGTIELGPVPLPLQNRNVLSFKTTPEGRIAIDASALADQLRADSGARDRFAEAVSEAQLILERCQHSNAGARLARLLENYLAATGTRLAEAKPSLLVQRGERLRQELQTYETPDSFLPPISDDLLNDLIGWRTAHNMMVALDPVLNAADLAMLGPDQQPVRVARDEIEEQVRQADAAGLIEDGEADIILEGIALAPQTPELGNRRTLWSVEVIRNLFTESVSIALNPFNADAQASAIILHSGLRAACGSIDHAKHIVEHRDWILTRLGSTPAWQDIITRLVDRLEAITPFQPK